MALYYIYKKFFVEGDYVIQENGRIFSRKKVTDKDGKIQEQMTQVWNDRVDGKEWKNIQRFAIIATSSIKEEQLPNLAKEIAEKHHIDLTGDRATLIARIRMDGSIKEDDKVILEWYLSGEKLPEPMKKEAEETQKKSAQAKTAFEQATRKPMTAEDWAN
jgi:hypothetical protein